MDFIKINNRYVSLLNITHTTYYPPTNSEKKARMVIFYTNDFSTEFHGAEAEAIKNWLDKEESVDIMAEYAD